MVSKYTLDDVKEIINKHSIIITEKFKVGKLWIFGSYARNEQHENSDIDILVEFNESVGIEFFQLKAYLEDLLEIKVDLVTHKALRKELKDRILSEVIAV